MFGRTAYAAAAAPAGTGSLLTALIPWVAVLAVFYLLLILPERKKQKKFKAMVDALKVGDEIITRGGICGRIANIKDEFVVIESGAEKTKIKITKSAVGSLANSTEEK
jgi:preprotein translocase subunit YajC